MKSFIFFLIFIISAGSFAQSKTGGGGSRTPPIEDPSTYINEDVNEGSIPPEELAEAFFVSALMSQEKECRSGTPYLVDVSRNIFKTYFILVGLKNRFEPDQLTLDYDSYLNCLSSPYVQKTYQELISTKNILHYLKRKYGLSPVQTMMMLVYFKTFDQGCMSDACSR